MIYTKADLRKLQLIDLCILLEVKRICELHNIRYFLIGGTLLGAVRHKGFIPWDDDIDIGMLREDYQKFIDICGSELRPAFYLQTKENDKACHIPFAKLRLKGTTKIEEYCKYSSSYSCGIEIDIFPYDNLPLNKTMQWLTSNIVQRLRVMYHYKCVGFHSKSSKFISKAVNMVEYLLSCIVSKKVLSKLLDKVMQLYNRKPSVYVVNYGGAYSYRREMMKRELVLELTQISFENHMFPCPFKYEVVLQNVYGDDYMCIPKKDGQVHHAIIELKFGQYSDIDKVGVDKLSNYIL